MRLTRNGVEAGTYVLPAFDENDAAARVKDLAAQKKDLGVTNDNPFDDLDGLEAWVRLCSSLRPRPFSKVERTFLEGVAAKLPVKEGERLRQDLQIAQVTPEGDFLHVELPGYERPTYTGHHNLPFEGKMRASDGGAISALVNIDQNKRLLEVEFIRWESSANAAPDWSTLTIVPQPPIGASKW